MEGQVVKRRINTISAHFGAGILTEDVTSPNSHLIPLNCSSSLSTTFKRLDNKLLYGRQASASQGQYMRQATNTEEQNCSSNSSSAFKRLDNRLLFGRQASASQGPFMRQATSTEEQDTRPTACSAAKCRNETKPVAPKSQSFPCPGSAGPLFARPVHKAMNGANISATESLKQDKVLPAASKGPSSAKPQEKQGTCTGQMVASQINGWSPRINVIESKSRYLITVELPGVEINDIRVEMDDKYIIVRGKRSMNWLKTAGGLSDSFTTYHRREISQGPYQVVWPLPPRANKESVSAELVEGILQITIPKL